MTSYDGGTAARASADSIVMGSHFWDLLMAETMKEAGMRTIYTENVRDFESIPWIEAVNPLSSVASAPKGEGAGPRRVRRRKKDSANPAELAL